MDRQSKNSRRKRKDPQSRDFICKCNKSYLSYAAAYTHVKNKHHLEKQFVDNIRKPEREKLRRGRPKEKKPTDQSFQIALLTLIESAILKICNELEGVFDKIILQGNQQRQERVFNQYFEELCQQKEQQLIGFSLVFENQIMQQFINSINKDFTIEIACRIKLIILMIDNMREEYDEQYLTSKLGNLNLWQGRNKVNQIIYDTFKQWGERQPRRDSQINDNVDFQ